MFSFSDLSSCNQSFLEINGTSGNVSVTSHAPAGLYKIAIIATESTGKVSATYLSVSIFAW